MTTTDQRIIDALDKAAIDYDVENFSPESSFKDNGIDSLDVMSLLLVIEEKYNVTFSAAETDAITTPAELSSAIDQKAA